MRFFISKFFAVLLVLSMLGFVYLHEQVHVQIFKSYGIESRVDYLGSFPDAVTYGERSCPNDYCTSNHNINEVVGYQLQPILVILGVGLLCIISFLESRKELEIKMYLNNKNQDG